ncbi:UDP-glycosyltransferase 708G1 [Linum grandiflorum]
MSTTSGEIHRPRPSPHVALIPSSGAGHIMPFLRLAANLVSQDCRVTLITCRPIVSQAESSLISKFLAAYPQVSEQQFHILPIDPSTANSTDPFCLQWEAIRRSLPNLSSILSSLSPPPAALFSDVALVSSTIPITQSLNIPNYVLFVSSARMFSLLSHYHNFSKTQLESAEKFEIPGIGDVPRSSIPPVLLNPETLFATIFNSDGKVIPKLDGVVINSFDCLESEALKAIRTGEVAVGLPPLFNVGLIPHGFETKSERGSGTELALKWLEGKPAKSVVYVSFGSRTILPRDQIKELGKGLIGSGVQFIWVVKDRVVDQDNEERLEDVLGEEVMEEVGKRGVVVKEWVDQAEVIGHESVGGFLSHCGWNSVVESAWFGVPIMGWPPGGDQKVNGEVVERCGIGFMGGDWGWMGDFLVKGEEISVGIKKLMEDEKLREVVGEIKEHVRKDVGEGGSLKQLVMKLSCC